MKKVPNRGIQVVILLYNYILYLGGSIPDQDFEDEDEEFEYQHLTARKLDFKVELSGI